jgi:hypothetical protein
MRRLMLHHLGNLCIFQRLGRVEGELASFIYCELAIERDHVKVDIQILGRPKALCRKANTLGVYESNGATPPIMNASFTSAAAIEAEQRPDVDPKYGDALVMIVREPIAHPVRQAQYELTYRNERNHAVS